MQVQRRARLSNFDRVDKPAQLETIKNQPKIDNSAIPPPLLAQAMRVYIGNLPKQCDAQSLEEYLGKIMVEFGGIIEAGSPITRTHLLTEELAGSALMEFRSVEETDAALQLTGLVFRGKVLEIRRPAQYYSYNLECLIKRAAPRINLAKVGLVPTYFDDQVSPASNKVFIGGLPLSMTADEVQEVLVCYGVLKAFRLAIGEVELESQGYAFCEFMSSEAADRCALALNGCEIRGKTVMARRVMSQAFEQELIETSLGIFQGTGPDFSLLTQLPGGVFQPSFDMIVNRNRPITVAEFQRLKQTLETLQARAKEQAQLRAEREGELFASRVGPPGMEHDHRMFEDIPGLNGLPGVTANLFPALNFSIHPKGATNVIRVPGIATSSQLASLPTYTETFKAIMEECSQYGTVTRLVLPRAEDGHPQVCIGSAFVEFLDTSAAVRASNMMKQKTWNGGSLKPEFFSTEKFKRNELE